MEHLIITLHLYIPLYLHYSNKLELVSELCAASTCSLQQRSAGEASRAVNAGGVAAKWWQRSRSYSVSAGHQGCVAGGVT